MKKLVAGLKAARRAFVQRYNEKGQEIPDPRPIEVPLGLRRPKDIHEMIHDALRGERMRIAAERAGVESFEEANDFELDEEPDLVSKYELRPMQEEYYDNDRRNHAANRRNNGRDKTNAGDSGARQAGGKSTATGESERKGASADSGAAPGVASGQLAGAK